MEAAATATGRPYDPDPGVSRFALRAGLRSVLGGERRMRLCGACAVGATVSVRARGAPGRWTSVGWRGLLRCGRDACPVCSHEKRGEKIDQIARGILNAGGNWGMLTPTIRHSASMELDTLMRGMAAAWRRCRQSGASQRAWTRNVTASARGFEVTWSSWNGWHPHIHVITRGADDGSDWTDDERKELVRRWQQAVKDELGPECVPDDEHAIHWGPRTHITAESTHAAAKLARYVSKLAPEVVGEGKDVPGSRSHWRQARAAANGDAAAAARWRDYVRSTKGRRMAELDDRLVDFASMSEPIADPPECDVDVLLDVFELAALRLYEKRDRGILGRILKDVRTSLSPEDTVRAWLGAIQATVATLATGPPVSRTGARVRGSFHVPAA